MAENQNSSEEKEDDESGGGLIPPVATLVTPCLVCMGQEHNLQLKATLTGCIGASLGPIKPMIDILELPDPIKIAADLPGIAVDLPSLITLPLLSVPDLPPITIPPVAPLPEISVPGPPGFGLSLGMMVLGLLLLPLEIIGAMLKIPPDIPTPDLLIDLLLLGIGIPSIGVLNLIECIVPVLLTIFLIPIALFP